MNVNPFEKHSVTRQAKIDAGQNIFDPKTAIVAAIGSSPQYDPERKYADNTNETIIQSTYTQQVIAEYQEQEEAFVQHTRPSYLAMVLLVLLAAEFVGAALIFRDLGLTGTDRTIMALMLACLMFYITWLAAKHGGPTNPTKEA